MADSAGTNKHSGALKMRGNRIRVHQLDHTSMVRCSILVTQIAFRLFEWANPLTFPLNPYPSFPLPHPLSLPPSLPLSLSPSLPFSLSLSLSLSLLQLTTFSFQKLSAKLDTWLQVVWALWRDKVSALVLQGLVIQAYGTRSLVTVEPRRPPVTDVGTETAFRLDQCKHFRKSKHLLRSEVSWCDLHLRRSTYTSE